MIDVGTYFPAHRLASRNLEKNPFQFYDFVFVWIVDIVAAAAFKKRAYFCFDFYIWSMTIQSLIFYLLFLFRWSAEEDDGRWLVVEDFADGQKKKWLKEELHHSRQDEKILSRGTDWLLSCFVCSCCCCCSYIYIYLLFAFLVSLSVCLFVSVVV